MIDREIVEPSAHDDLVLHYHERHLDHATVYGSSAVPNRDAARYAEVQWHQDGNLLRLAAVGAGVGPDRHHRADPGSGCFQVVVGSYMQIFQHDRDTERRSCSRSVPGR